MSGTLNGAPLTRATLVLPAWGIWWADVVVASSDAIATGSAVELVLGGQAFAGTVRSGGVRLNEGRYRIVGGADGWSTELLDRSYQSALGVRRATVVADAATECGETIGELGDEVRLGPAYARARGEASLVLDQVAPEGWYVSEAGVTHIGARAASAFSQPFVAMAKPLDRDLLTVAAESIVGLVPGATVDGLVAASVRHELTPDGLRSHVWGEREGVTDRLVGALRSLVRWFTRETWYHRLVEYRVVSVSSGALDLRPARGASGAPALANVPMLVGVPGGGGEPQVGGLALVAFVDGNPLRPMVVAYEGPLGAAHVPTSASLLGDEVHLGGSSETTTGATAAAEGRVVRYGDPITFGSPGPGIVAFTGAMSASRVRG